VRTPVRDFGAKRVISLHWNEDVADDRLDRLVAFATTHNWASSDREALARLRPRSCIVDGEAVACGEDGVPSFDRIRYRQHDGSVFLYAFDLIELNGDDLRRN
jgi:hypothetical protein